MEKKKEKKEKKSVETMAREMWARRLECLRKDEEKKKSAEVRK